MCRTGNKAIADALVPPQPAEAEARERAALLLGSISSRLNLQEPLRLQVGLCHVVLEKRKGKGLTMCMQSACHFRAVCVCVCVCVRARVCACVYACARACASVCS